MSVVEWDEDAALSVREGQIQRFSSDKPQQAAYEALGGVFSAGKAVFFIDAVASPLRAADARHSRDFERLAVASDAEAVAALADIDGWKFDGAVVLTETPQPAEVDAPDGVRVLGISRA